MHASNDNGQSETNRLLAKADKILEECGEKNSGNCHLLNGGRCPLLQGIISSYAQNRKVEN